MNVLHVTFSDDVQYQEAIEHFDNNSYFYYCENNDEFRSLLFDVSDEEDASSLEEGIENELNNETNIHSFRFEYEGNTINESKTKNIKQIRKAIRLIESITNKKVFLKESNIISTDLGEVDIIDTRIKRKSGYGQYSIEIEISFEGKTKTIKLHTTDSQLFDKAYQEEDHSQIVMDGARSSIENAVIDYINSL